MFGYVHPSKERLDEKNLQLYKSVYCGLCEALKKDYGFIGRMTLSYDLTFLAMLSIEDDGTSICQHKCIRHPFKGTCFLSHNPQYEKVSAISIILSYWQIEDSIQDSRSLKKIKYYIIRSLLKRKYQKARRILPEFDQTTSQYLDKLSQLEKQHCNSIDRVADCFACLLSEASCIFTGDTQRRVVKQLLYHLGRWIYIVDAVDDFSKDQKTHSFNVLRYRFMYDEESLSEEIKKSIKETLDASIRMMAASFELCPVNQFSKIVESVVYEGLYLVERDVLSGNYHKQIKNSRENGEK